MQVFAEHRKRPLVEHLADFRQHLQAQENSPKHVIITLARIEAVVAGCTWVRLADLSASQLLAWTSQQRTAGKLGIKTANYYVAA